MATPSAILGILVRADTGQATAALAKTDAQLAATAGSAQATTTAAARSGTALRKLGTAAKWGGAALAAGFVYEAKKAVDTTQELTKATIGLSANLGLSTKKASEWGAVAKARGVDSNKLGMAFKTLATQVESARGGSDEAKKSFDALGLSQRELEKGSKNVNSLIFDVSRGMEDLGSGTERTAIASKLFGRGWQTVVPLMRDGAGALRENLDLTEKYGATLTGKTLKAQTKLLQNTRESKIAWMGIQVSLARLVTPALNDVHQQFQQIAAIMASDKLTSDEKFAKVAKLMQEDFQEAMDFILGMIPTIAEGVGRTAPKVAVAFVQGFTESDVWGKLAIGGFLISKMGGLTAIKATGTKIGGSLALGVYGGLAVAGEQALTTKGGILDTLKGEGQNTQIVTDAFKQAIPVIGKLRDQYGSLRRAGIAMGESGREEFENLIEAMRQTGAISDKKSMAIIADLNGEGKAFHRMAQTAQDTSKTAADAFRDMQVKIGKSVDKLGNAVSDGMNKIAGTTNAALRALGVDPVNFKAGVSKVGNKVGNAVKKQRGGLIPGSGSGDKVHAMLEPGEVVLNRKAVSALGGAGRANSINSAIPRFATGGVIQQALGPYSIPPIQYDPNHAGGNSHLHLDFFSQAQAIAYGKKMQGMGWSVGEYSGPYGGFGPITTQHQSPGHYDGTAFDANTAANETRSQVAAVARMLGGAGGIAGVVAKKIARVLLEGPAGALRSTGQGALDKVRNAANTYLSKQSPVRDAPTGMGSSGLFSKPELASLWSRANGGLGNPSLMAAIALAESGGNPQALNPSGASGLWQILGKPFPGNAFDPMTNARMAGAKLSSQGLGAWEAYTNGNYTQYLEKGGRIRGPMGSAQAVVGHGGESVLPVGATVELHLHGDGAALMAEMIDAAEFMVDGKAAEIAEYTIRAGGQHRARSRQLAGKGGRV